MTFSAQRGKWERAGCRLVNPRALGGDPLVIKGRGDDDRFLMITLRLIGCDEGDTSTPEIRTTDFVRET